MRAFANQIFGGIRQFADALASTAPTVTTVSVTPSTISVAGGAAQQFAAVVAGINSPSQAVVWSKVGNGAISTSGLFTAPAATSSAQTVTVTATSTVDGSKAGSAVITVAALAAPQMSFTPSVARTITVEPGVKPFTAGTLWTLSDPKKPRAPKDSDSTVDYSFNWGPWLLDVADAIAAHEILLTEGLVDEGSAVVSGKVTVFVSAGNPNKRASITCRITTASTPPRTEDRTIFLDIEAA